MQKISIEQAIEQLIQKDPRYPKDAYDFVREALDFTIKQHRKKGLSKEHHVTGGDLLDGMRAYALQEYGPMAHTLLGHWNLKKSEDIGNVVFNMVDIRILKTSERDSRDDFKKGFDFKEAFLAPFEPESQKKKIRPGPTPKSTPPTP